MDERLSGTEKLPESLESLLAPGKPLFDDLHAGRDAVGEPPHPGKPRFAGVKSRAHAPERLFEDVFRSRAVVERGLHPGKACFAGSEQDDQVLQE